LIKKLLPSLCEGNRGRLSHATIVTGTGHHTLGPQKGQARLLPAIQVHESIRTYTLKHKCRHAYTCTHAHMHTCTQLHTCANRDIEHRTRDYGITKTMPPSLIRPPYSIVGLFGPFHTLDCVCTSTNININNIHDIQY
jgi:hypothetical protein